MLGYYYENRDVTNRVRQKSHNLVKSVSARLDKLYLKKQRLLEDLLPYIDADPELSREQLNMHVLEAFEEGDFLPFIAGIEAGADAAGALCGARRWKSRLSQAWLGIRPSPGLPKRLFTRFTASCCNRAVSMMMLSHCSILSSPNADSAKMHSPAMSPQAF